MDKKDIIIENLQDQVKRVKRDAEDVGRMNATVDDLGGKLRKKEE
jgi:ABC-type transporter Mla subunit MlaD